MQVSDFGNYQGYSREIYKTWKKSSDYIDLKDGNRVAYDLFLPDNGKAESEPFPVLMIYTPYLRAFQLIRDNKLVHSEIMELSGFAKAMIRLMGFFKGGNLVFDMTFRNPYLKTLLRQGYAVLAVEQVGTGASSGRVFPSWETSGAYADEIITWAATQSWSNGKIGMFGASSNAMVQYAAMMYQNTHLKAIMPVSSGFDLYRAVNYPGGIYNESFNNLFADSTGMLEDMIVPVDGDVEGRILKGILEERHSLSASSRIMEKLPYYDSTISELDSLPFWESYSLASYLSRINGAQTAVYNVTGWYDLFTRDGFLWQKNLTVPRKLYVHRFSHKDLENSKKNDVLGVEINRWFDYWLKNIDNGIMDEDAIHYVLMSEEGGSEWKSCAQWPLSTAVPFYLDSADSHHPDGILRAERFVNGGCSEYPVDKNVSTGGQVRWNAVLKPMDYPLMNEHDNRSLTFYTAPFEKPFIMTGHPLVKLRVRTDADDIDLFCYLNVVDAHGHSRYLTEGQLRLSHGKAFSPSWDNLDLPFHSFMEKDRLDFSTDEWIDIELDLLPTAYSFSSGERLCLSIACADTPHFSFLEDSQDKLLSIGHEKDRPSALIVPVLRQ